MTAGWRHALLAWALAAAHATGGHPPAAGAPAVGAPALISPEQARRAAWSGFADKLPLHPPALRDAASGTTAARPLLVERLDRPNSFYYIVPFTRQGRTTLVVLVDARDGAFKEAAPHASGGPYPAVDEAAARRRLAAALPGAAAGPDVAQAPADLVWKPSAATQSMYEPLWRFRIAGREWYVDQQGQVLDRIAEPELKGGGPPGAAGG